MKEIFNKYGFNFNKEILEKFNEYYNLLVFYNEKFNITAITEKEEVYKKHFLDSVFGLKFIEKGKLIDIGSGGGFPAIPLKICNDDINLTMLEATGKKCEFLNEVCKKLDLKNVEIINGRAEDYAKNSKYREQFDYCTARAVARLNILAEYSLPFIKIGGFFIPYKGKIEDEIQEALNGINKLGGKIVEKFEFCYEDSNRYILKILKEKKTDLTYPRSNGKIRKTPL